MVRHTHRFKNATDLFFDVKWKMHNQRAKRLDGNYAFTLHADYYLSEIFFKNCDFFVISRSLEPNRTRFEAELPFFDKNVYVVIVSNAAHYAPEKKTEIFNDNEIEKRRQLHR